MLLTELSAREGPASRGPLEPPAGRLPPAPESPRLALQALQWRDPRAGALCPIAACRRLRPRAHRQPQVCCVWTWSGVSAGPGAALVPAEREALVGEVQTSRSATSRSTCWSGTGT